ncbi:hypothetical protein NQ317_001301 [Molorchus minor]|uniref:Uncharacterized protein n=1 Tax=Molorchus minor TaxID=1323400 RepID=A0ABQ9JPK1_9CUCU|nr:hypothetical protein NQ317_001301 [Molorchus minor]
MNQKKYFLTKQSRKTMKKDETRTHQWQKINVRLCSQGTKTACHCKFQSWPWTFHSSRTKGSNEKKKPVMQPQKTSKIEQPEQPHRYT